MTVFNKKCVAYKLRKLFEEALMVLFFAYFIGGTDLPALCWRGKIGYHSKGLSGFKEYFTSSATLPRYRIYITCGI